MLSARRLLTSERNWLYLRNERLNLSAQSKHSGSYAAAAKDRNVTNACAGNRMIARPSHGACVESQIARVRRALQSQLICAGNGAVATPTVATLCPMGAGVR